MKKEVSDLDIALNKLPGWKDIAHQLNNLSSDEELEKLYAEFEKSFEHDLDYDFEALGSPPASGSLVVDNTLPAIGLPKTIKVSIRIPTTTVMAFKEKSKVAKVGYQTLINRVLKSAAKL